MRFNKKIKRPLNNIKEILPLEYTSEIIVREFWKYYPLLWDEINERYKHYSAKDSFLLECGKKKRYNPLNAEQYILDLPQIKLCLSKGAKEKHRNIYNKEIQAKKIEILENKRRIAVEKSRIKIAKSTETIQKTEPLYIDAFISAYHQKGISTEGKIEIFNELKKYENKKTIVFFYKLNDAERNNQIRNMAFYHLQSLGLYVNLRSNFDGRQKAFMIEKSDFNMTPVDLWDRIENDSIQNNKQFDFFISHSSGNKSKALKTIESLNKQGYNAYCDWTSDNDFLKRELVSEYTKIVLKKRLEQSDNLLLLCSKESLKSEWVDFELQYYKRLFKPIYYIRLDEECDLRLNSFTQFFIE